MSTGTRRALGFVLLIGAVSFFADFTYEGARSIAGPYLAVLGAGALAVSLIAGLGELLGYGLRVASGRLADRPRNLWPITLFGYAIQMAAVPALALAGSWQVAALLMMVERIGKATRNPPRDVMLAHAGARIGGFGWAFGINEALDQAGAVGGPLLLAAILALHHGGYRLAFAVLLVPAAIALLLITVARLAYPRPAEMEAAPPEVDGGRFPSTFWIYLVAAALIGAGFADFPLIAFHLQQDQTISASLVPIFYAVGMGTGGLASLLLGRLFDRRGFGVLIPLTVVSAAFAPLAFLGGPWPALIGVAVWGLGMGAHESLIPAAVAPMVPAARRGSAYGLFTAVYGIAWFAGSAAIGGLYTISPGALVAFSVTAELAAVPPLVLVLRRLDPY